MCVEVEQSCGGSEEEEFVEVREVVSGGDGSGVAYVGSIALFVLIAKSID